MTSKRAATASNKAKVSSDGSVVTISEGWRTLHLPSFTIGSMTYGEASNKAASSNADQKALSATGGEQDVSAPGSAYEALLATLAAPRSESQPLVKLNPWIYSVLAAMTFNAYFVARNEPERLRIMSEKEIAFEIMIGWIVRLFNMKCWVLPIVLLSLWFFKCSAAQGIWNVGSHVRILYTKATTELIAFDLGSKVQMPAFFPSLGIPKVGVVCV
jgi:hypothetical protein